MGGDRESRDRTLHTADFPHTHQALRDPGPLHGLQGVVDPAVVAGVVRGGSLQPEDHRAVVVGGQLQELLQAAHALVGDQLLLPGRQAGRRPEGVVLRVGRGQ